MEKMSCDYLDGDASVKSINMLLSTKAQQSDHPTKICDKNDAVNNQSYLRNTAYNVTLLQEIWTKPSYCCQMLQSQIIYHIYHTWLL